MIDTGPPQAHPSISRETAAALVAEQHPDLSDLRLGERFDGWDMAMYRLGEEYAVRLPRAEAAVASLRTESRWLAELAPHWDFPCPRVARHGRPGAGYPWEWSIVTWVPGNTADEAPMSADAGGDVGRAIAQVHTPAPTDATFNVEQSLTMAERVPDVDDALAVLTDGGRREVRGPDGELLDVAGARTLWAAGLAAPGPVDRVWIHADLHGSNLLSRDGAFAGIIDWGKMAAGDRAVDLAFLYTAMPRAGVSAAVEAYLVATGLDDAGLHDRLTGIAVSKCLRWATLDRPLNVTMAWRGLAELGLAAPA